MGECDCRVDQERGGHHTSDPARGQGAKEGGWPPVTGGEGSLLANGPAEPPGGQVQCESGAARSFGEDASDGCSAPGQCSRGDRPRPAKTGRASCRERGCQYG